MTSSVETSEAGGIVAPIVEERLHVDFKVVETGRVAVRSTVAVDEVAIREVLEKTSIRVERVPVDRLVDAAPRTRTEGNRTIVPVTEEVMVKQIRLIEEIHLVREERTELFEESVPLRRIGVSVDPTDPETGQVA